MGILSSSRGKVKVNPAPASSNGDTKPTKAVVAKPASPVKVAPASPVKVARTRPVVQSVEFSSDIEVEIPDGNDVDVVLKSLTSSSSSSINHTFDIDVVSRKGRADSDKTGLLGAMSSTKMGLKPATCTGGKTGTAKTPAGVSDTESENESKESETEGTRTKETSKGEDSYSYIY